MELKQFFATNFRDKVSNGQIEIPVLANRLGGDHRLLQRAISRFVGEPNSEQCLLEFDAADRSFVFAVLAHDDTFAGQVEHVEDIPFRDIVLEASSKLVDFRSNFSGVSAC